MAPPWANYMFYDSVLLPWKTVEFLILGSFGFKIYGFDFSVRRPRGWFPPWPWQGLEVRVEEKREEPERT